MELIDIIIASLINDTIELGIRLIRPKPNKLDFIVLLRLLRKGFK
jgi:hypothetical protein